MRVRGWNAARWIRLALAIAFLLAGIASKDTVAYAASFFFAVQAALNLGCCGTPVCQADTKNGAAPDLDKGVSYQEIK